MREMKFRAWHKPSSAMMMVHTLHWNGNGECIGGYCHDDEWNEIAFDVTHTIIMQFTGLHDKNGKEIYEGDILKWKCSTTYTKDKVKLRIVTIQWGHWPTSHGYDLTIYENGNKYATGKSYWNDEDREVIGNVFQNKELLNDLK